MPQTFNHEKRFLHHRSDALAPELALVERSCGCFRTWSDTHPTFIMSLHLLIDIKRLISKLNPIICFRDCIIMVGSSFGFFFNPTTSMAIESLHQFSLTWCFLFPYFVHLHNSFIPLFGFSLIKLFLFRFIQHTILKSNITLDRGKSFPSSELFFLLVTS